MDQTVIIDKAIATTLNKMKGSIQIIASQKGIPFEKLAVDNFQLQLTQALTTNNYRGFTRDDHCRTEMEELGKIGIIGELFRHQLKKTAVKDMHAQAQLLQTKESLLSESLAPEDVRVLITQASMDDNLGEAVQATLQNQQLQKLLVSSFVTERYGPEGFRNRKQLDECLMEDFSLQTGVQNLDRYLIAQKNLESGYVL